MQRFTSLFLLTLAAACADPVVSLNFQTSLIDADLDDTSCLTNVEVYVEGNTYPANASDFASVIVPVNRPATYAALLQELRGKLDLPVPQTGLKSVDIYGWNGDPGWADQLAPSELVFYGRGDYADDETLTVPLKPNISCKRAPIQVRPLDLMAFVAGGHQCAAGAVPDEDPPLFADLGTFAPLQYQDDAVRYFGGKTRGDLIGGVATFEGPTTVGPNSCLAIGAYGPSNAIACASTAGVCGRPGEVELLILPNETVIPTDPEAKFGGVVIGAVYSTARLPVAGAKIDVDPAEATVRAVNLDPATRTFTLAAGNTTTDSGMFAIWTNKLVTAQVTTGSRMTSIKVGSIGDDAAAEYIATSIVIVP